MQLCNWYTFKLSTKNGEGFRRGLILKHCLMDVDFNNPVRVRVSVMVSVRIWVMIRVRVGVRDKG